MSIFLRRRASNVLSIEAASFAAKTIELFSFGWRCVSASSAEARRCSHVPRVRSDHPGTFNSSLGVLDRVDQSRDPRCADAGRARDGTTGTVSGSKTKSCCDSNAAPALRTAARPADSPWRGAAAWATPRAGPNPEPPLRPRACPLTLRCEGATPRLRHGADCIVATSPMTGSVTSARLPRARHPTAGFFRLSCWRAKSTGQMQPVRRAARPRGGSVLEPSAPRVDIDPPDPLPEHVQPPSHLAEPERGARIVSRMEPVCGCEAPVLRRRSAHFAAAAAYCETTMMRCPVCGDAYDLGVAWYLAVAW
jgi:hypothetical protein